jgi:beta-lactam-binding protein with PASTA domain
MTKEEAETAANSAKISLEYIDEISEDIEAGIIIRQETEQQTEVNAGDTVKVYISVGNGKKQVVVTSVLQYDQETAKGELEALGLAVKLEYAEDKEKSNGTVLKQSIESGETVDEGTTITLTINKFAEEKECEVKINVAKLTGYTPKVETTTKETNKDEGKDTSKEKETGTESAKEAESKDTQTQVKVEPEKVTVAIYVDNNEYDTGSTKRDDTAYTRTISATGTITIKIVIKDSAGNTLVTKTKKSINLNETNSIIFE